MDAISSCASYTRRSRALRTGSNDGAGSWPSTSDRCRSRASTASASSDPSVSASQQGPPHAEEQHQHRAAKGERVEEEEDKVREIEGIFDIFTGRIHVSGQSNGKKATKGGRNGVEGKKVPTNGTYDRSNFIVTCG